MCWGTRLPGYHPMAGVLSKLLAQGLRLKLTERNTFSKDEVPRRRGRCLPPPIHPPSISTLSVWLYLSICLSVYLGAGEMHMHMHAHMPMMRAVVWVPAFLGADLFLGATYIHLSTVSVCLSI